MNLIIAGCRDFNDYELLSREVKSFAGPFLSRVTVVSGHAKGADKLGEKFAQENGLPLIIKPADWAAYGKAAGPKRNEEMARISSALVAFWDGQSRGTKNMIELARKHGLRVKVVRFDKNVG
ncbi:MAG: DUF2493 domain-containing protein [Bacteroidales bacterium]|nr:DUF2493 domain-containing protein [Bacteroidales bacterium]